MLQAMRTLETFEGKTWALHVLSPCPHFIFLFSLHPITYPLCPTVWQACRTARVVTPAVVTAARTPSTKQPRRRVSSLPLDASLGRRRRADPAFLARTPPAKVWHWAQGFYSTTARLCKCSAIPQYQYCCVSWPCQISEQDICWWS